MAGQPKAPFYIAMGVVIFGLVAFAISRRDVLAPPEKKNDKNGGQKIEPQELGQKGEATDTASVTTVKEYKFRPAERLPPIKGTSAYKPLADNTVRFALNVW